MNTLTVTDSFRTAPVLLRHGEVASFSRARGMRIVCEAGRLWLTEEGVAADFLLAPGQAYRVRGGGRVVVEAVVADATLVVLGG